MYNAYKKPMWNDNPLAKDLSFYFNDYELKNCCFGGDDTDTTDSTNTTDAGEGEDFDTLEQEDLNAAMAAAGATATGAPGAYDEGDLSFDVGDQGKMSQEEFETSMDAVNAAAATGNYTEEELQAISRANVAGDGSYFTPTGDVAYKDFASGLAGIGKGVSGLMGGIADQAKGLYGASQLGPVGALTSALTGTGPWADYGRGRGPFGKDAPFYDERLDRASLNLTPSGIPSIEARKEHLDARANLGMGDFYREGRADKKTEDKFKADYDAQAAIERQQEIDKQFQREKEEDELGFMSRNDFNAQRSQVAKARDEQFQREREEEELGFLTPERVQGFKRGGLISLQEGGQMEEILYPPEDEPPVIVPEEPEVTYPPEDEPPVVTPEPGFEPTGSPMKDYFLSRKETPVREPNKYLVELFRNISGGKEDIKDTWRRLGWTPKEERTFITPPTPKSEPVRHWKNREINDYTGLTKEQQKMKYEDDLQHANPDYGEDGTGYEASSVRPPWEWSYYNEQATV